MKLIVSSSVFCTVHTFFYRDLVVGINTLIVAMQTFIVKLPLNCVWLCESNERHSWFFLEKK